MIKKLTALLLLISAFGGQASTLTFTLTNYFSSPFTNTGVRVYPISTPINVDGSFTITGLPIALNFDTNTGVATTNLMQGNYLLTNTSPLIRMLFAVPVSTNTYEVSQLAISGFNTYNYTPGVRTLTGTNGIVTSPENGMGDVIIDGAAFAPTAAMITNALGFFPLSPTQVTNVATNSAVTVSNNLYALLGTAAFSNSTAFYLRSNPSNYVSGANVASSNYVTASITNTLASNASLTNATNAIYVQLGTAAFTNSTNFYPRSNPSNFATASITNNLASIGYALNLATNATNLSYQIGLLNTNYSKTLGTNSTNYAATLSTNATNFTLSVGTATTNFVLSTSNALRTLNSSNFIANTNGTGYVSLTIDGTFNAYSNVFVRGQINANSGNITNSLTVGDNITSDSLNANSIQGASVNVTNFGGGKALVSDSTTIAESTVTTTELTYVSGVTNAIQTQINAANALITTTSNGIRAQVISRTNGIAQATLGVNGNLGVQTNITVGGFIQATNISASRALVSDAAQRITNSVTTSTELAQLSGVTGNVQTNFNGKLQATNGTASTLTVVGGGITVNGLIFGAGSGITDFRVPGIDVGGVVYSTPVTVFELGYLSGTTGGIQTNLDARIPTINGRATNTLTVNGNLSVYTNAYIGSLTVTNAQTNQALIASSFVTTGGSKQLQSTAASAALALTLSDETGTGSVVFSNAPVITSPTFTTVTATDSLFNGTNAVAGDWAYVGTNMTSVVDGQNIVNPKTNVVLRITGTPTAAWTLSSIQGGRLNRVLQIINSSGYSMTVANESGFDSTAANRILTGTGASIILTNNPSYAEFTYDSISSRWVYHSTPAIAAAGSGITGVTNDNVIYVSIDGDDSSGLRNREDRPFSTLAAAKLVHHSGDLVYTHPGTFDQNDLASTNINWYFEPGTTVEFDGASSVGIFDDHASVVGGIVRGGADFIFHPVDEAEQRSMVILTNPASQFNLTAHNISHLDDANGSETFAIHNCSDFKLEADLFNKPDGGGGFLWEKGTNVVIHLKEAICNENLLWDGSGSGDNTVQNMFAEIDYIKMIGNNAIYGIGGNTNSAIWLKSKLIEGTGQLISGQASGKIYVESQKYWDHSGVVFQSLNGANQIWARGDKLTSSTGQFVDAQTGTIRLQIQQYNQDVGAGNNDGFSISGGTLYVNGGEASCEGVGINHYSGTGVFKSLNLDTSSGTNFPVFVHGSGLTLANCVIVASNGVPSLYASNSQTVTINGTLTVNTTPSTNITFTGGVLIDTSVNPVVNTNFISGQFYTNRFGRAVSVSANAVLTEAAVVGFSAMGLRIEGSVTNSVSQLTAIGGLTGSVTNFIFGEVPDGARYVFTNLSSGTGNSSALSGGQIKVR